MATKQECYITKEGLEELKAELENLTKVERPEIVNAIKEARALGDLSENAEYRSARRAFGRNESRIRFLQKMIRTAKVISTESAPDEVGLFDRVEVIYEDTGEIEVIRLSTTTRLDLNHSVYSKESPFGKAIIGHKVGDRIMVKVSEDNSYFVTIKSITKGEDDENIPLNGY